MLPPCSSDSNIQQEYINSVIGVIEKNESEIKGAILELRDNTGGDMGPTIAAVSPLLPDGTLMEFSVRGNLNAVTLNNGVVDGGGTTCKVDFTKKLSVPVAILQNELTASSGEATLICFKGLENVKTFGTDSAGYCSVNIVKYMYNGACIQLTIGKDVDRKKNEYCENPIPPDMQTDIPLEDATNWIKMH